MLKNALLAYLVSGLDLTLLVTANLIIPALATKEDFGNYRLMILYAGYAGFFHCGLLNGLYLTLLGRPAIEENAGIGDMVRRCMLILQLLIVPCACSFLLLVVAGPGQRIIVLAAGLAWLGNNIVTFHNYFWQASNNFSPYAKVNIISKSASLVLLGWIIVSRNVSIPWLAVVFLLPIVLAVSLYELIWARIVIRPGKSVIALGSLWKRGAVLDRANMAIMLLFTSDKLCFSWVAQPEVFATYALAYTLTNTFTGLTESLSTALVPHLAQKKSGAEFDWVVLPLQGALICSSGIAFWISSALAQRFYPQYADPTRILWAFSVAAPFSVFIRLCINARAIAFGRETSFLRFSLAGGAVMFSSLLCTTALTTSPQTIATVWACGIVVSGVLGWVYMRRSFPLDDDAQKLFWTATASTVAFVVCRSIPNAVLSAVVYTTSAAAQVAYLVYSGRSSWSERNAAPAWK